MKLGQRYKLSYIFLYVIYAEQKSSNGCVLFFYWIHFSIQLKVIYTYTIKSHNYTFQLDVVSKKPYLQKIIKGLK